MSPREVEHGDEIGRRRAGAAAASCLAVGVRRSCAPSRQRRPVFRPRAVRSDENGLFSRHTLRLSLFVGTSPSSSLTVRSPFLAQATLRFCIDDSFSTA
jgi:hypothetical protein